MLNNQVPWPFQPLSCPYSCPPEEYGDGGFSASAWLVAPFPMYLQSRVPRGLWPLDLGGVSDFSTSLPASKAAALRPTPACLIVINSYCSSHSVSCAGLFRASCFWMLPAGLCTPGYYLCSMTPDASSSLYLYTGCGELDILGNPTCPLVNSVSWNLFNACHPYP